MANGETFDEIRRIIERNQPDEMRLKDGILLSLAALADIHDKVEKTDGRLKKVESSVAEQARYPSLTYLLAKYPLKFLGAAAALGLAIAAIISPEARQMLAELLLGWL